MCHGSPWSMASRHASHWDRGLAGKGATKKKKPNDCTISCSDNVLGSLEMRHRLDAQLLAWASKVADHLGSSVLG